MRSRGGKVVKRIGDGLMLSFPSAESAVLAALELVEVPPGPLRLRAGVHTGEAAVTADDLIGHDVNVAARVAAVASGGQVLATVAVRDEVGDLRGVDLRARSPPQLQGRGAGGAGLPRAAQWLSRRPTSQRVIDVVAFQAAACARVRHRRSTAGCSTPWWTTCVPAA